MILENNITFNKSIISIDLETTGLSQEKDKIIEIGSVKYDHFGIKESEFETFVNPGVAINSFVQNLTGITDNDLHDAPMFDDISPKLESFLTDSVIIGHNVGFDKGFLSQSGMDLNNIFIDTWRFAQIMLPELQDLSLGSICNYIGVNQLNAHRAKSDAEYTMQVFIYLINKFEKLDIRVKSLIKSLILKEDEELYFLFNYLVFEYEEKTEHFSLIELINKNENINYTKSNVTLQDEVVDQVFSDESEILNSLLSNFSYRSQQHEMSDIVLKSIYENKNIAVEAGTGVGKSLAYLLPSAIYALNTGKKIVVSTNTINLQEQLYSKDLPLVNEILNKIQSTDNSFNYCTLKGRDNYLCLSSFGNQLLEKTEDIEYARFLAKILVWINNTTSGDKSELGLSKYVDSNFWSKLTHKNRKCFGKNSGCFFNDSKIRAEECDVIVVNHALLMSDVKSLNQLIPNHEVLIIDEAHNLEDVASQHLGWRIDERVLRDLSKLDLGKINILEIIERIISIEFKTQTDMFDEDSDYNQRKNKLNKKSEESVLTLKEFINEVNIVINSNATKSAGIKTLRVTKNNNFDTKIITEWNDCKLKLDRLLEELTSIFKFVKDNINKNKSLVENLNDLITEWTENYNTAKSNLDEMFLDKNETNVFWIEKNERFNNNEFFSAPINVSDLLNENLFSNLESTILTSATLNSNDNFTHLKNTVGLKVDLTMSFGSPFDYDESVNIVIPKFLPEPNSSNYLTETSKIIFENVTDMKGFSMALFTSHQALRETSKILKDKLDEYNINVLAQGLDGSPHQILKRFKKNPQSIILGTSSFWEGVDIDDGSLKLLIILKLPFDVPTHPLFQARSEQYKTPFFEYAIPRAIIKFKQGFGRLIRNENDKGKVLLLDPRVITKQYGKIFLESLPGGKLDFGEEDYL